MKPTDNSGVNMLSTTVSKDSATIAEAIAKLSVAGTADFAIFTDGEAISRSELFGYALRVAVRLADYYKLQKGARVAILAPSGPGLVAALSGCWFAGMIAIPLDTNMPRPVLERTLTQIRPDVIVIDSRIDRDGELASICSQLKCPLALLEGFAAWPNGIFSTAVSGDDPALVIFTSGSTGMPKGAVLSQANLVAGARNIITSVALTECDRAMCVLPLSHLHGLMATFIAPLISGGTVVFLQGTFEGRRVLQEIDRYKCTWMSSVPTQYAALMKPPIPRSEWSLETMRFCRSASASLLPRLRQEFEDHYGIPIIETLGMTEASAQIFSNLLPPAPRPKASVGKPVGFEVRIVGDDGNPVPIGAAGEIQIKGSGLMLGYLDSPEETEKTYDGEWLKSGDLGRCDADGYYYITGRKKDIAIFSGINISLRALEVEVLDRKLIDDIGCVAEADSYFGERVVAYITTSASEAELPQVAKNVAVVIEANLLNRQALKEVRVIDHVPRTSVGKIVRHMLDIAPVRYARRPSLPTDACALLSEILSLPVVEITDDIALGRVRQWDSLAHTVLVLAVEEILGRLLEEREIFALTTFRGLSHVLAGTLPNNDAIGVTETHENPDLLTLMAWNRKLPCDSPPTAAAVHDSHAVSVLSYKGFCNSLRAAGLEAGDLVMVQSDISTLGLTEAGLHRDDVLEFYLSAFLEVLGPQGTLCVCTSYEDYGRYGSPFVREESPSRLGAFSEYVRTRQGAERSLHPILSISAIGSRAKEICGGNHFDGFGYDSPWGRLHRSNAKQMTIGMSRFHTIGLTFVHYIEHLYGVPYQYTKIFQAPVYSEGALIPGPFTMSVRYLDFGITYDSTRLRDLMLDVGEAIRIPVGNDAIFCTVSDKMIKRAVECLGKDRWFFLKTPPNFRAGVQPMDGATGDLKDTYDEENR